MSCPIHHWDPDSQEMWIFNADLDQRARLCQQHQELYDLVKAAFKTMNDEAEEEAQEVAAEVKDGD